MCRKSNFRVKPCGSDTPYPLGRGGSLDSGGTTIRDTITDSQGYYSYDNLCPDTYKVKFELPNTNYVFARQTSGNSNGSDPSISTGEAILTLTMSENSDDIDAGIVRKRFCGTAWEDVDKDGIKDVTDLPLEKVIVYLKNTVGTTIRATTSNYLGEYYFTNILNGTYYVEFNPATNSNGIVFASGTIKDVSGSTATDIGDSDIDPYSMRTNFISVGNNETACDIGAGFSRIPLPVELLDFSAKLDRHDIVLDWITASEINNSHFEIEIATNDKDFTIIDKIDGAGNSIEYNFYNYRHEDVDLCTTLYYRLRQIDFDGTYEYSKTVQIDLVCSEPQIFYTIYPNPTSKDEVNLYMGGAAESDRVDIAIINGQGKLVRERTVSLKGKSNEIQIDLSGLDSGIYYTLIMDKAWGGETKKFIKLND